MSVGRVVRSNDAGDHLGLGRRGSRRWSGGRGEWLDAWVHGGGSWQGSPSAASPSEHPARDRELNCRSLAVSAVDTGPIRESPAEFPKESSAELRRTSQNPPRTPAVFTRGRFRERAARRSEAERAQNSRARSRRAKPPHARSFRALPIRSTLLHRRVSSRRSDEASFPNSCRWRRPSQ